MKNAGFSRRQQVVDALTYRMRSGELRPGDRLDGELRLAAEFAVSRGTIRQALSELQRRNMIATHTGIGSFVTFDGVALDAEVGWGRALADTGTQITAELMSIDRIGREDIPDLPGEVTLTEAIAVRRIRRAENGVAVSYECSSVPFVGPLRDLPSTGLVDGSLTTSLRAAGLIAQYGAQDVRLSKLDRRESRILGRKIRTPFLRTVRTAYAADGSLVEHVVSLLDPDHFSVHFTFGEQP
ncbi:GntR family transcriptional regulator [Antricoccus suffuscus]|uniref:GntR family transcriptional regulator n=1 Tax=Antricoccus suffuscus TaxID=1629062 RepID=A0A2T0ZZW0_9ACTN|nr:GntR family transcriptional regulator [Antricoccus suffuscus]PRZ41893.1 GntR family transcriptional regulator [Antricoccus suffuscus]